MNNLFIVILEYLVSLEVVSIFRESHLAFLDLNYLSGNFIASGPQVPREGGVIVAKANNLSALEKILSADPFMVNNIASYQIYEFTPTKYSEGFNALLRY